MPNSARHPLDRLPSFPSEEIPPEEFDALAHVMEACRLMMQLTEEFAVAINLFDFCADGIAPDKTVLGVSRLSLVKWRQMAGRDAGMTMYHFGMAIETVRQVLAKHRRGVALPKY